MADATERPASMGRLIAGGMSGTSADGVDVAIVKIDGRGYDMTAQLVRHHHRPYNRELREQIFAFRGGTLPAGVSQDTLRQLAQLGREVSLTYAAAVNEALAAAHIQAEDLAAIAAHGQTLFHDPPNTVQWLDPSLLAAEVGCAVVSDFRRADLAAGGQGAPLVPFADYVLFRDATKNRVLLNLGGIANFTWLPAGGTPSDVIAFDTGPANCVIDHLARQHEITGGIDRGGALGMSGKANFAIAFAAIRNWKLVFNPPPKSADTPEMINAFESTRDTMSAAVGATTMSLADQLATACLMSALGIDLALKHLPGTPDEIIVSGGGVENAALMREIRSVNKLPVRRIEELGVSSDAKEAIAFALLAAATLDGVPSSVPSVTGARRAVVLGSITPRP